MKTYNEFNTGRQYTPDGQRIIYSAELVSEDWMGKWYRIVFYDVSRMISGAYPEVLGNEPHCLLERYDGGGYESPSREELKTLMDHYAI